MFALPCCAAYPYTKSSSLKISNVLIISANKFSGVRNTLVSMRLRSLMQIFTGYSQEEQAQIFSFICTLEKSNIPSAHKTESFNFYRKISLLLKTLCQYDRNVEVRRINCFPTLGYAKLIAASVFALKLCK